LALLPGPDFEISIEFKGSGAAELLVRIRSQTAAGKRLCVARRGGEEGAVESKGERAHARCVTHRSRLGVVEFQGVVSGSGESIGMSAMSMGEDPRDESKGEEMEVKME